MGSLEWKEWGVERYGASRSEWMFLIGNEAPRSESWESYWNPSQWRHRRQNAKSSPATFEEYSFDFIPLPEQDVAIRGWPFIADRILLLDEVILYGKLKPAV